MGKLVIAFVFCCCFIMQARGQASQYHCADCSIGEAKKIQLDFEHIQEARFYCFLHGFSLAKCRSSSEYMQFANPLLFDILLKNSGALINILKKYPELYTEALHKQLQTPLLDFNINRVIFVVDSANGKSKVKKQLMEDLDAINVDERGYPR